MPYIGKKPADIIATVIDTTTGTFSGEVDAGSLDVSGNADIDGTTNLDNTDIDGTLDVSGNLTVDTNTLYVDSANNNVGIGTSSPSGAAGTTLAINGGSGQSRLALKNTSTGDASGDGFQLSVGTDGSIGIEQRENNYMALYTNATERMRIDSSGNVGIGTSSITSGFKLEVAGGDVRFGDAYNDDAVELGWSAGGSQGFVQAYDRGASAFRDLVLNNSITIESGGNVGIGTSSPSNTFDIHGDTAGLSIRDTSAYSAGTGPSITFVGLDNNEATKAFGIISGVSVSTDNGLLTFQTRNSGTLTERMRIDNSGNVGIGTSSPDQLLHISGGSGTTRMMFTRSNTAATGNSFGELNFENSAGTTLASIKAISMSGNTESGFVFGCGGGNTERMRIDNSGNVGIGTSSPNEKLTVNSGALSFLGDISTPSIGAGLFRPANNTLAVVTGSTERMRIDSAGHVTMPYQSAFSAKVTTQQSNIATSTQVTVPFATELYDQNSDYNNSTYTFTAPVTGKYQLNVLLLLANVDSASSYYQTALVTSNRTYYQTIDPRGFSQDVVYLNLDVSVLADMDAGDTAIVRIYQATGTAQTDLDAETYFTGYLVA